MHSSNSSLNLVSIFSLKMSIVSGKSEATVEHTGAAEQPVRIKSGSTTGTPRAPLPPFPNKRAAAASPPLIQSHDVILAKPRRKFTMPGRVAAATSASKNGRYAHRNLKSDLLHQLLTIFELATRLAFVDTDLPVWRSLRRPQRL